MSLRLGLGLVFGGISRDHDRVGMRLSRCLVLGESLVVLSMDVVKGGVG